MEWLIFLTIWFHAIFEKVISLFWYFWWSDCLKIFWSSLWFLAKWFSSKWGIPLAKVNKLSVFHENENETFLARSVTRIRWHRRKCLTFIYIFLRNIFLDFGIDGRWDKKISFHKKKHFLAFFLWYLKISANGN
jgi:hypothetical protein